MRFHADLGPAPKVGLEIEVPQWQNRRDMFKVAGELEGAGYAPAGVFSQKRHDYHCRCATCVNIGMSSQYPVMWKMQYDASLPDSGAEFISSPFPVEEWFMNSVMEAIEIIARDAVWSDELPDMRGRGLCSPGLHVHCYAAGPEIEGFTDAQLQEALYVYSEYIPELFAIAQLAGVSRPLTYRSPDLSQGHHAFLDIAPRGTRDRSDKRLEWRLFEIPYTNLEYVEAVIYLSAALTQLVARKQAFKGLAAIANLNSWDRTSEQLENVEQVVAHFNKLRFDTLRDAVLTGTGLKDDDHGAGVVERLLRRVG